METVKAQLLKTSPLQAGKQLDFFIKAPYISKMDRLVVEYLKVVHGALNAGIMLLFLYQGWVGLRIRKARKGGGGFVLKNIRRHRKLGPILVLLGLSGFFFGLSLVYTDKGRVLEYPLHSIIGLLIALSLVATLTIARKIAGPGSPWRTPHFLIGIAVVCIYVVQVFTGLGVLL